MRKEPRFAEIAMLIMSAAQIYGRKVDYVEEFILNLCKSFASMEQSENKDGYVNNPCQTICMLQRIQMSNSVPLHNVWVHAVFLGYY